MAGSSLIRGGGVTAGDAGGVEDAAGGDVGTGAGDVSCADGVEAGVVDGAGVDAVGADGGGVDAADATT
jgi:hypothetical protein